MMANLENNYDKEKEQHLSEENKVNLNTAKELVKDAVQHPVETARELTEQAAKDVTSIKWWAKLLLIVFWTAISLAGLGFITINLDITKQWAANQALKLVNQDFKAKMTYNNIDVNYFGDISIQGLKIQDEKGLDFIKIREFKANSNWIGLIKGAINKNNHLSFNSIQLTNADIKVVTYKGDSISNFIKYIENFDSGKPSTPNRKPFQMDTRVAIVNSKVSIINQNSEGDQGRWLMAHNVNLLAPKIKIDGKNISGRINNFSFITKRWGKSHFVDTFSADIVMTPDFLSLKDLTINTDHTLMQGNLKFNLNNGSWKDFSNKVKWEMDLATGSQISGYDISYFVTNWDNYQPVNISGKMEGTLNNFQLKNFVLGNKEANLATNQIRLTNLLNGDFIINSDKLTTDFTYIDLKNMLPTFISEKMKNFADDFGRLKYSGDIRVMPEEIFVANGNLIADIGQVKMSNFSLNDYSTTLPRYKGYFELNNLNTTIITKMPQVGLLSGKFNLEGQSFDLSQMVLNTKAEISKIEILDKTIHNLHLNGILDQKTYNGIIKINDEHAVADIKGLINFQTAKIKADVFANINKLNINYFLGKPTSQNISGILNGKIEMSNLNDLDLDTNIQTLTFNNNGKIYKIPHSDVKVYFSNGNRVVEVDANNAIKGRIAGRYNLEDLAGMIQNGLQKVLISSAPRKLYHRQSFNIEMEVKQNLINYFEPNLKLPYGAFVNGSYDGSSNNLVLNIDAPKLVYAMEKNPSTNPINNDLITFISDEADEETSNATIDNFLIKINTANLEEQIFAKINRVQYKDNILKEVSLTGRNQQNKTLHFSAKFLHGSQEDEINNSLKDYAINLNQSTNDFGDYIIRFEPTSIRLNAITWSIDTNEELNHSITYSKKTSTFLIENFRIYSDDSSLLIKNGMFQSGKDFAAQGEINNLQISKLLEMQKDGNTMEIRGLANGNFDIRMHKNNLMPLVDLDIKNIKIHGDDMGDIAINAKNSATPNVFDIEAKIISSDFIGNNNLHITGTIDNNTSSPTLDIKAYMKDFDLAFTQEFVKGIFGNLRGKANGILTITGPLNDIDYSGDIALSNLGLKLNFTGVDYTFEDTIIQLSKGLAILNDVRVKDGRPISNGTISGAIQFDTLSSMAINLIMRAGNLMVLNTQQKDFDLFWGRVYGEGYLYVSGPVSSLNISTDLNEPFKALNNSTFTFNAGSTSGVDEFKMLRFLKENSSGNIVIEEKEASRANLNLDFNIAVDRGTTVNVMLPENVGSISVKGTANPLRFRMENSGNITMNGSYMVDNGTFISQAILERTFQIQRGSTIRWGGNAMTPELDIIANYTRAVTNAGSYLGSNTLPAINVLLEVNITGTLNNPKIDLGLTAPDLSSQLKETLANKMMNEDEKVIQFGSVLVMNSFNVQNSASGFDLNLGSTLENTGYNLLFKQLGSIFNTISEEVQVDINYLKGDESTNTSDRANASVNFALSPRVSIKTGMGVPLSRNSDFSERNYLSGEGIVEYDWSRNNDKTRLLRVYSKPSNIGLVAGNASNSDNQAYGAGVVYSRSFNIIFKRKNKSKKADSVKAKSNDSLKIHIIE